jgi:hypothetical protein
MAVALTRPKPVLMLPRINPGAAACKARADLRGMEARNGAG